jgi:predicted nucleotidyltransferase
VQQRFEADLLVRVQGALAAVASGGDAWGVGGYEVLLFGSRARGDWDGRSDTGLLELGQEPPHTPVLNDLVGELAALGVEVAVITALSLKALTRMTISSRYPIATAEAVIAFLEQLDRPGV